MTYEQTLQAAERGLVLCQEKCPELTEQIEYQKTIIDALKKQIPKKPLHMHKNYYCPRCEAWLLWDDALPNSNDYYCGEKLCGQAIDWSDVE